MTAVVVPTLNERENVEQLVREIDRVFEGRSHLVVVVDDGSSDGTREILRAMKEEGFPLVLIERGMKSGIGSAVREGLRISLDRQDVTRIVTMDADLSHDPAEMGRLLAASHMADLVQGSRYVSGGEVAGWSRSRRIVSRIANALAGLLLGTGLKEHTTYYRVYSVHAARAAASATDSDGYEWALESLEEINHAGMRVVEVPITFRRRGHGSSKMSLRAMIKWWAYLVRRVLTSRVPRPRWAAVSRFATVGALGLLVNQFALFMMHGIIGVPSLLAAAAAVEMSVISNFVLNDQWTFRRDKQVRKARERLRNYHIACFLGIGVNLLVFGFLSLGLGVHYLVASIVGIVFGFLANYRGSVTWAWVGG